MTSVQNQKPVSVYFMVPTSVGISPGQRFRFEHYLKLMEEKGIRTKIAPYFSMNGRKALYSSGRLDKKVLAIASGIGRRMLDLFKLSGFQYVYIHREAAPVGPPFFEWIVAKIMRKKIVYDFDDAIWVPAMSDYNSKYSFIKFFSKVGKICKWSYKVTVGNKYLKAFADQHTPNAMIIPTVVNTEDVHKSLQDQDVSKPAVGWTGSFSTLKYIDIVLPVLQKLQSEIDFTFFVIADIDPQLPLKNYRFIKWNLETEEADLLNFHIGLMPLPDDEITRGKCGFKAIQYMSLGMPALVSPIGVNTEIVQNGADGYTCATDLDWENALRLLLTDKSARHKMGQAARNKIVASYSVKATEQLFLDIFK